jgi:hypothetical protein
MVVAGSYLQQIFVTISLHHQMTGVRSIYYSVGRTEHSTDRPCGKLNSSTEPDQLLQKQRASQRITHFHHKRSKAALEAR